MLPLSSSNVLGLDIFLQNEHMKKIETMKERKSQSRRKKQVSIEQIHAQNKISKAHEKLVHHGG